MSLSDRIISARFTPVRMREGYDMGEVDAFLDRLAEAASAGEPLAPLVDGARFKPVRMREGYDMSEVDAFLAGAVAESQGAPGAAPGTSAAAAAPATRGPVEPRPTAIQEQRGLFSRLFGKG